jgi:hypothetical protein
MITSIEQKILENANSKVKVNKKLKMQSAMPDQTYIHHQMTEALWGCSALTFPTSVILWYQVHF